MVRKPRSGDVPELIDSDRYRSRANYSVLRAMTDCLPISIPSLQTFKLETAGTDFPCVPISHPEEAYYKRPHSDARLAMVWSLSAVGNGTDPADTPGAGAQPPSSRTTFSLSKVLP